MLGAPLRIISKAIMARAGRGGALFDLIHNIDFALWFFGPAMGGTGSVGKA